VDFTQGGASSTVHLAMLNGANAAVIGDGTPDNWEVFQFETAEVTGTNRYALSRRLRGQAGTDAIMPDTWPTGSIVVLLNGDIAQIESPAFLRNVTQHFRIGPSQRPVSDGSYRDHVHAFKGNGLRPYAPVWLNARGDGGDTVVDWIRRDRLHGDSWDLDEIPMSETQEQYRVRVMSNGAEVRLDTVQTPSWTYSAAMKAADGVTGPVTVSVAQMSSVYGAGLSRSIEITL